MPARDSPRPPNSVRLQKLLAAAGVASRRGAEDLLRAGRVAVNGEVARLGQTADPDVDVVTLDGSPIEREPLAYWMVHKPRGVITTARDPEGRPTVLDLLPEAAARLRLFPVGRLDRDTEGLVLLTNDGALAQVLLHPSHESEREYKVSVKGRISDAALRRLAAGIELEDGRTAPARVGRARVVAGLATSTFRLTVIEGRKRQIRRALEQLGHPVVRLVRMRMGPLRMHRLPAGEAQEVSGEALRALLAVRDAASGASPRRG
ncbi:MAG: rRNA pseudouridine synthase [Deltaproteobacteria bacterium]|nr:rRNA pseudouridine synthase [Deltaproteobacteria bacterium]